ncbi:unnamed protein product [Clonostachys rhizophaga]|uniref:Clr5 domain-containing protein n=1 Tax=Clonostachys rhizophaga TaxID=160324 RepID=A0A9N9YFF3_9HYPO|nr:unnamed protein product [Clonostachys rhizophaga]
MPSSSKDIPDEVWSQHKGTILKLRFDEGLPLDAAKSKSRNTVQVMKDDHGFEATAAQYETQLKKWKASKNIKRKDWETILPIYNDLERRGLKPRVRLSDRILAEGKVRKARRYRTSVQKRTGQSDALSASSGQTRLWRIEYCRDDGTYSEYFGGHLGTNNRQTSPQMALSLRETNVVSSATHNQSAQESFTWNSDQNLENTASSQLDTHHPFSYSPMLNFEDFEPMPSFLRELDTCPEPTGFGINGLCSLNTARAENLGLIFDDHDFPLVNSSDHLPASTPGTVNPGSLVLGSNLWDPSSPRMSDIYNCIRLPAPSLYEPQLVLSKERITFTLGGIFKDPALRLSLDLQSVSAQHIIDSLQSLLFDYGCGQGMSNGLSLMAYQAIPASEIFKRVIFSIANNFAVLTDIPRAIIFGMLKNFSKTRSDLMACLQSQNINFSKPLADNLFRAAVEAGDEEVVGIILDTTFGQANAVDINEIVCELGGMRYSALSMAAYLHRPAMVRKLLEHGAKVGGDHFTCGCRNKHYHGCLDFWNRDCPLTVVFDQYRQPGDQLTYMKLPHLACNESEAAEIVKLILDREPAMVARLLKWPIFFETTSDRLLELLVQAVPPDRHAEIFKLLSEPEESPTSTCRGLYPFVGRLEPQRAKHIVSTLLLLCQRIGCQPSKLDMSFNYVTNRAILSKQFDLADYFLAITQPDQSNLAAAIRSRRTDLVDSLLEQGALMRYGTAPCCDDISHPYISFHCGKPTTPLAEAIRLQDPSLIKRLGEYGALNRIQEAHLEDFAAALFATVEVADCFFLDQLLATNPIKIEAWNSAISEAIGLSHFEIAIALIRHDATRWLVVGSGLVEAALKSGNTELVQTIVDLADDSNVHKRVVMASVQQGDTNAVKALLELDGESLRDALVIAVESGNVELAAMLLERGATPEGLDAAIEVGDVNLLNLLLRHGADPADEYAFLSAIYTGNIQVLEVLVEAFTTRYPYGKQDFVQQFLFRGLGDRGFVDLDLALRLKSHPNGWLDSSKKCVLVEVIAMCRENEAEGNEMVRRLINAGVSLEFQDKDGMTALLQAVKNNNLQQVEFLLQNGANINRPARWGLKRTPLQQACEMGSFEMVQFLVTKDALINAPPAKDGGGTALQLAAISGSVQIVQFLLCKGAEIHAAPALKHGRTALEGAAEHGRVSVLDILLQRGAQGYSRDDISKAKFYAEKEKQRGCEERLKQALFWTGGLTRASLN